LEPVQAAGIASFLSQTDAVAKTIIVILLLMSVATWYLIVTKTLQTVLMRRRSTRFLETFWNAPSLQSVATHLEQKHPDEPFSHLAWHGIVAARHHQQHGVDNLNAAGSKIELYGSIATARWQTLGQVSGAKRQAVELPKRNLGRRKSYAWLGGIQVQAKCSVQHYVAVHFQRRALADLREHRAELRRRHQVRRRTRPVA